MSRTILNKKNIDLILARLAYSIIEGNAGCSEIYLIGIRSRGVPLAERLKSKLEAIGGITVHTGILDITIYRDDLLTCNRLPEVKSSELNFDVNGKNIILVDDVLFTGRTIHAALNAIMEFGRPATVKVAVLIDRGHRELPIAVNYVGKSIDILYNETIDVFLEECDGIDIVNILS